VQVNRPTTHREGCSGNAGVPARYPAARLRSAAEPPLPHFLTKRMWRSGCLWTRPSTAPDSGRGWRDRGARQEPAPIGPLNLATTAEAHRRVRTTHANLVRRTDNKLSGGCTRLRAGPSEGRDLRGQTAWSWRLARGQLDDGNRALENGFNSAQLWVTPFDDGILANSAAALLRSSSSYLASIRSI
jgi:hypothetical protein